jgi:hypothetical protein
MAMTAWRMDAGRMLRQGLGVEDIAVKLSVPVADVRQFVSALRKSGRLSVVLFGRRSR